MAIWFKILIFPLLFSFFQTTQVFAAPPISRAKLLKELEKARTKEEAKDLLVKAFPDKIQTVSADGGKWIISERINPSGLSDFIKSKLLWIEILRFAPVNVGWPHSRISRLPKHSIEAILEGLRFTSSDINALYEDFSGPEKIKPERRELNSLPGAVPPQFLKMMGMALGLPVLIAPLILWSSMRSNLLYGEPLILGIGFSGLSIASTVLFTFARMGEAVLRINRQIPHYTGASWQTKICVRALARLL